MTEQSEEKRQEKSSVESELNKLQDKTARIGVQQLFFAEGITGLSNILGKQLILALAHSTTQKMTTYHKRWRWVSEAKCLYSHYPGTLAQGEVIRATCQKQLVTPMGPARFDSCYSWWPHHVKSSCLSSEIQQRAASTVAWAANRLKKTLHCPSCHLHYWGGRGHSVWKHSYTFLCSYIWTQRKILTAEFPPCALNPPERSQAGLGTPSAQLLYESTPSHLSKCPTKCRHPLKV